MAATTVLNVLAVALPGAGVPPEVMLGLQAAQLLLPDVIALARTLAPAPAPATSAMPVAAMATLPARFQNPALTKDAAEAVLAAVR